MRLLLAMGFIAFAIRYKQVFIERCGQ